MSKEKLIDELTKENAELKRKVEALAAENSDLKSGSGFFMYSEATGFEFHKTKEDAITSAEEMIGVCREEAASEGWPEEADTICWGVIIQKAIEGNFEKASKENGWIGWSEYSLSPAYETPATDAELAEIRAQGVESFTNTLQKHIADGDFVGDEIAVITGAIDAGGEFAENLRKEAGND